MLNDHGGLLDVLQMLFISGDLKTLQQRSAVCEKSICGGGLAALERVLTESSAVDSAL